MTQSRSLTFRLQRLLLFHSQPLTHLPHFHFTRVETRPPSFCRHLGSGAPGELASWQNQSVTHTHTHSVHALQVLDCTESSPGSRLSAAGGWLIVFAQGHFSRDEPEHFNLCDKRCRLSTFHRTLSSFSCLFLKHR